MKETIIIIGATSGVGLACAQSLAEAGYRVIISGRSQNTVDRALAQVRGDALGFPLDFTSPASISGFFTHAGPFDHLALVGSGQAAWGPFRNLKLDALKVAFDNKFYGFFLCAQAGLPQLRKDGSITFVIGGACRSAIPSTSGVAAVNGAIQAMAFTLAKELAPMRVNILSPGLVDTPMYDWMKPEEKQEFFQQMGSHVPVGRVGRPAEIAEALLFLVRNAFTTGAILDVDGGNRLH
jgi:NAD(P)-dependent dehydrogenase (short-subunit alcohol dehydrogenase family)